MEENLVSEKRLVSNFNSLKLSDFGQVVINQGPEVSLKIEAEAELLPKIRSEVTKGMLHLRIDQDWIERLVFGLRSLIGSTIKYTLTVKHLNRLYIGGEFEVIVQQLDTSELTVQSSGLSKVELISFKADRLEINLSGRSEFRGDGKVNQQKVTVSGTGEYLAKKLDSQLASIYITGQGNSQVWVNKELKVEIAGIGQVKYTGEASVSPKISGLGSITKMADTL